MTSRLQLTALPDLPLVEPGDDLVGLITDALERGGLRLHDGDVLVIAQKIVSKAEARYVPLREIEPSEEALELAARSDKDPRLTELILRESKAVLRCRPGLVIVEHRNGWIHANAGIDHSNIESDVHDPRVLLLPRNPDASAERIRTALLELSGAQLAVIINDSAGRAWRRGVCGFAIGSAGFRALSDRRGQTDLFGRMLEVTEVAVADELAAAASHVMGQAQERQPVVLIRGADLERGEGGASELIRPQEEDLFR